MVRALRNQLIFMEMVGLHVVNAMVRCALFSGFARLGQFAQEEHAVGSEAARPSAMTGAD